MKLLDKLTKWFFNTIKIEVNTDWRLVALEKNRKLIETEEKLQEANQRYYDKCVENEILYQRIADLEKLLGV